MMITMERNQVDAEQFKALTAPLTTSEERTAASYWLSFCTEWDRVASVADEAGQTSVREFFDDMADVAADFWTDLSGDLGV